MASHVAAYRAATAASNGSSKPLVERENQNEKNKVAMGENAATIAGIVPGEPTIIVGDVHVKDSKDVVFDNVTVFEGPVTVQKVHLDSIDKLEKEGDDDAATSSDPCGFGSCAFRWAVGLAIVALVVVGITMSLLSASTSTKDVAPVNIDVHNGKDLVLISREGWGGEPPKHPADNLTLPVPFVIISHTATENCTSQEECSSVVLSVQNFHMNSRNWWDIGYNFLVGGDGRSYEGRGWDAVGAHARSYNNVSIGISFIGTFTKVAPPQRQVDAAHSLIAEGVKLGKVAANYNLLAHRQISPTESPGEVLFEMMKHWPHWVELENEA